MNLFKLLLLVLQISHADSDHDTSPNNELFPNQLDAVDNSDTVAMKDKSDVNCRSEKKCSKG